MKRADTLYARANGVAHRQVDDHSFLIDDIAGRIHAIDPMAAGLWKLLEEPISEYDIVSVFHSAFPDQKTRQITKFVRGFLSQLERDELVDVVRTPDGPISSQSGNA